MSLYSGNKATDTGGNWKAGAYKFIITEAKEADWGLLYSMKTWTAEGAEGPNIKDALRIGSDKDAVLKEVDRRLTTMLGKPEIDSIDQLVNAKGWVVLRKGHKYLEPMPFGAYFASDKKSATGKADSILGAIEDAQAYDWTQDSYAVQRAEKDGVSPSSPSSPEDSETMPF